MRVDPGEPSGVPGSSRNPGFRIDLDAYCARIGYAGPRRPTLAVLDEIQRRHSTTIPFENLDILLGRRISVDPSAVERKLVQQRRGGYCFEQSTLMLHALEAMGFEVETLIARIRWQIPEAVVTNLGHMLLRVELDGRSYLADAGLGNTTLTAPLELKEDVEQATPLDRRRLVRRGNVLLEQINFGAGWLDVCVFSPDPVPQPDFELGNWYYCTHPDSIFIQNLLVARPDGDRRYAIFNHEFSVRHVDGRSEKKTIASRAELVDLLQRFFGLDLPADAPLSCPGLAWPA